MRDFISEIRKISTEELICWFSTQSITMFDAQESLKSVEIPVVRFGRPQNLCVALSAWDILNIDYLSVKFSKQGWQVIVIWECELKKNVAKKTLSELATKLLV